MSHTRQAHTFVLEPEERGSFQVFLQRAPLPVRDMMRYMPVNLGTLPAEPHERVAACKRALLTPEIRSLNLVGGPGVGKSWLVGQLNTLAGQRIERVAFSYLDNWLLALPQVAEHLGVGNGQQSLWALKELLIDHLRTEPTLLILDAFETVLPAAKGFGELLEACPDLKLLISSRLAVPQGHRFRVLPLAVPDAQLVPTPEEVHDGVSLFYAHAPSLTNLTGEEKKSVVQLCWHLDGLPLALIAAAQQVSKRGLAARQDLRDASYLEWPLGNLSRHATLYEALSWQFEHLSKPEQVLLASSSLFGTPFAADTLLAIATTYQPEVQPSTDEFESLESQGLLKRLPTQDTTDDSYELSPLMRDYLRLELATTANFAKLQKVYARYKAQSKPPEKEAVDATTSPLTSVTDEAEVQATSDDVVPSNDPETSEDSQQVPDFEEDLELFTEELTERELDVLRLVVRGLSNREVAQELNISHRTVSTHLSNVYGKLNVRTRTAAALRAQQLNLVDV